MPGGGQGPVDLDAAKLVMHPRTLLAYAGFIVTIAITCLSGIVWGLGHFATSDSLKASEERVTVKMQELAERQHEYESEAREILAVLGATRESLAGLKAAVDVGRP